MEKIKQKNILLIVILIITNFTSLKLFASHVMGADLSYSCVGVNQFKLKLSIYRDCAGVDASTSYPITAVSSCGSASVNVNLLPGYPKEVSPICVNMIGNSTCNGGTLPGVQEFVYEGIITLPTICSDWVFGFSTCCRNSAITTLSTPGSDDLYIEATLNNTVYQCDNSPVFTTLPVPYVCNSYPYIYNHGAIDADGDSLYYSLVPCLMTGSGSLVSYVPPFNSLNPLTTLTGTTINNDNGNISFTPNGLQVAVMAILVQEYRNGVLIGSAMRDIQVSIVNCTNIPPIIDSMTNVVGGMRLETNKYIVCIDNPISFNIVATDSNRLDTIKMNSNFNTNFGGTFLRPNPDTPSIMGTFFWTPNSSNIGINSFIVSVSDNSCPIVGNIVKAFDIIVVGVGILGNDTIKFCNSINDSTKLEAVGSLSSYNWRVISGDFSSLHCSNCNPNYVHPTITTTYEVEGLTPFGCKDKDTITLSNIPGFNITASNDTILCGSGTSIVLGVSPDYIGTYNYLWTPDINITNSTIANPIVTVTNNIKYVVKVQLENTNCFRYDTVNITLNDIKNTSKDILICNGQMVQVGLNQYTTSGTYVNRLISSVGCDSIYTLNLTVDTTNIFLNFPNDTELCKGDSFYYTLIINADSILWDNGSISTTRLFNSLGTYYVTAYNNCGLRNDTFTIYKCLTDSLFKCKISVPNAFTPNNDGKNDGFRAYTNCESLKSYNLRIYNRFGEVIFNSTDIYEEWDGRYKNILQDIGVFAFLIEYESEYTNGIEIVKGNVTLVK